MADETGKYLFAHVVGTFDLAAHSGRIDYVTPVRRRMPQSKTNDENINLVGESAGGAVLFTQPVDVQRNSCAPHADRGTFEAYVPIPNDLQKIELQIANQSVAEHGRGAVAAPGLMALRGLDPSQPHKLSLTAAAPMQPTLGVSYTLQAKPQGTEQWQTLAVGMPSPDAEVDVNEFPGASGVEVRLLQTDGFSESVVFQDTKAF